MRYVSLFFAVVFVLFAYWQINDPDPVLWVTIYIVASYVSWRLYAGKVNAELLWVLLVLSVGAAANTFAQMTAWEGVVPNGLAMKSVNQELAREGLGLLICSLSFLLGFIQKKT
jgi:hypothetical protein